MPMRRVEEGEELKEPVPTNSCQKESGQMKQNGK